MASLQLFIDYSNAQEELEVLDTTIQIFPIKQNNQVVFLCNCQNNKIAKTIDDNLEPQDEIFTENTHFTLTDRMQLQKFICWSIKQDVVIDFVFSIQKITVFEGRRNTSWNNWNSELKSLIDFLCDFDIERNTTIYKRLLLKNTPNNLTKYLPPEMVDYICNFI